MRELSHGCRTLIAGDRLMLEYRLDDLHWADFEKLCQALLKAKLGVGVEAWGGSGDWGNDAYCQAPLSYPGSEVQQGPFQFQAKFVQGANAAGAKPRAPLVAAVKKECERIKKRKQPPPLVYSLLTNVVLSPQLRGVVEGIIQDALSGSTKVIVHGGNDICSWLHMHEDIVRVFPQLLSHRNLSELVKQSLQGDVEKKTTMTPKPELSAALKKKKKQARAASRKHNTQSALRLWSEVRKQAEKEGNKAEELGARLKIVLAHAWDERIPNEALKLADECLRDAKTIDLGDDRCLLLQLIGEAHRIKGNIDLARGFIISALEHARKSGSSGDEGFALLSLSALDHSSGRDQDDAKALANVELAYNAFATLYASGDNEKQKSAKDGFAQCHCWKAKIFDHVRPDDALAEWTRALEAFQSLGKDWDWDTADTLLQRANLRIRIGEHVSSASDLDGAAKLFQHIGNTVGLAKCYLNYGELLDSMGRRNEAAEQYQQAVAIAATWKNDSRASYFNFRYACKLAEMRKFDDAESIFLSLANADWLERELKLTVISQLCLIAQVTKKDEELKERCSLALSLIDNLIQEATTADARRSLLIKKAQHLEQVGQYDQALQSLRKAIERFEEAGDQEGVIECWSQIRGIMQHLKDRKKEREAADKILSLGAEKICPMIAAITLQMLAQLNIEEQRFSEASAQLDRAEELEPKNPVGVMIAADLRRKLPQLLSQNLRDSERLDRPPQRDLRSLIQELHEWCKCYPKKREAILPLWYYIRHADLWGIFRSMLGVKFLICAVDATKFDKLENSLRGHGDLYVWGTNFGLKSEAKAEWVPLPLDLPLPPGTTLLLNEPVATATTETTVSANTAFDKVGLLKRTNGLPDKRYYLACLRDVDGFPDGSPFFGGRKFRLDPKVATFMLDRPAKDLVANNLFCLPLNESEVAPNLKRTMQVAWENGAIPVFSERLPYSDEISAVCDSMIELPIGAATSLAAAKKIWANFLSSYSDAPQSSLATFNKEMAALHHTELKDRLPIRVYLLRFQAGSQVANHAAVVIT